MTRRILLVAHPRRTEALHVARDVVARLVAEGIQVALMPEEAEAVGLRTDSSVIEADPDAPARDCELVCVLGGDGTILRGAEMSRGTDAPLLGVNLGHVGFLAEAEREDLRATVERIVTRDYTVEERMTLDVRVARDGEVVARSWALNEVSVEKASRERMLELALEIDGRPLSTFGADGIVMATPTGSTAYAFSAGGPVVWPDVEAMLMVPISAHALFARPLVIGPGSKMAVEVLPENEGSGVMWCDGDRMVELPPGARIDVCAQPDAGAPGPADDLPVHGPSRGQVRPAGPGLAWRRAAQRRGGLGHRRRPRARHGADRPWPAPRAGHPAPGGELSATAAPARWRRRRGGWLPTLLRTAYRRFRGRHTDALSDGIPTPLRAGWLPTLFRTAYRRLRGRSGRRRTPRAGTAGAG